MSSCRNSRLARQLTSACHSRPICTPASLAVSSIRSVSGGPTTSADYQKRVEQIGRYVPLEHCYPRLRPERDGATRWTGRRVLAATSELKPGATDENTLVTLSGRVTSVRVAGAKLVFLDLIDDGVTAQIVCDVGKLNATGMSSGDLAAFRHIARRGDWYTVIGHPHKTQRGQCGLLATALPALDSPSLHQIPTVLEDAETSARKPHLHMLTSPEAVAVLKVRSQLEHSLSCFLFDHGFHKVSTPLLSAGAGGAVARPFETTATELRNTKLHLRIAPELWLKRLVVGGLGRVYEIGPAFRNEGVDATHNPEFTMCEFYMPYANLEELMVMTQSMLASMRQMLISKADHAGFVKEKLEANTAELRSCEEGLFSRLPFIPTLESEMGCKLPDLDDPTAASDLVQLITQSQALPVPADPTLPRLLDALCSHYIEPLCKAPTFITEHPVALSPLAKSFRCPNTNQNVSARAELFIQGREYANMYEEENSPAAQRAKFLQQLALRRGSGDGDLQGLNEESYIEALEYGLPPTGGWGMGVDRLVMLCTGQQRIGDVLPFGTLRNVVGLAANRKPMK